MNNDFEIILISLLVVIFLLGCVSNVITLIVYRSSKKFYSSSFLIFTLATVNFLSTFTVIPFLIVSIFIEDTKLPIGDFYCGISYFLRILISGINISISIIFSYERFFRLKSLSDLNGDKDGKSQRLSYFNKRAILFFSTFSFLISLGTFYLYESKDSYMCTYTDNSFHMIYYCLLFVLLLASNSIIVFFYTKSYFIYRMRINKIDIIQHISVKQFFKVIPDNCLKTNILIRKEWKIAKILILVNDL